MRYGLKVLWGLKKRLICDRKGRDMERDISKDSHAVVGDKQVKDKTLKMMIHQNQKVFPKVSWERNINVGCLGQRVICDGPQERCLSAGCTVQDHREGKGRYRNR